MTTGTDPKLGTTNGYGSGGTDGVGGAGGGAGGGVDGQVRLVVWLGSRTQSKPRQPVTKFGQWARNWEEVAAGLCLRKQHPRCGHAHRRVALVKDQARHPPTSDDEAALASEQQASSHASAVARSRVGPLPLPGSERIAAAPATRRESQLADLPAVSEAMAVMRPITSTRIDIIRLTVRALPRRTKPDSGANYSQM